VHAFFSNLKKEAKYTFETFIKFIKLHIGTYKGGEVFISIYIFVLRWIFRKWDVGIWTGLSWLRIETIDGNL
jgi:hypothetical protein